MGTKGFIVIKANGAYHAFYNPHDSDPQERGCEMVQLLIQLIRRFAGDIRGMCEFIKTQISRMKVVAGGTICWKEWNVIDIIMNAKPRDKLHVEEKELPKTCIHIEYVWILDFDLCSLALRAMGDDGDPRCTRGVSPNLGYLDYRRAVAGRSRKFSWPMKHLYRYFNADTWAASIDDCLEACNCGNLTEADRIRMEHPRIASIVIIQTWWRSIRGYHQAFEPGTGCFFHLSRNRFEAAATTQQSGCIDTFNTNANGVATTTTPPKRRSEL